MKLIIHLVVFALGVAAGVAWGVHHPAAAKTFDLQMKAEVAKAKIEILNKVAAENPKSADTYQKMAQDEQQKLNDANGQLANQ